MSQEKKIVLIFGALLAVVLVLATLLRSKEHSTPLASGTQATCPTGAKLLGSAPPLGREQWCEKPSASGALVREGAYLNWNANGSLAKEGEYHDGKRAGRWTYYDENGQKIAEGPEGDGPRSGTWKEWHRTEKGVSEMEGEYAEGKKEKVWVSTMDDGTRMVGRFSRGWREGTFTFYRGDIKVSELIYEHDVLRVQTVWDALGVSFERCTYKNGGEEKCETRPVREAARSPEPAASPTIHVDVQACENKYRPFIERCYSDSVPEPRPGWPSVEETRRTCLAVNEGLLASCKRGNQ